MSPVGAQSTLFLSCDLTGSTDFKQSNATGTPWQKVFLQFYREFPQEIAISQAELGTSRLKFHLWKPVGDELIFTCDVSSERDIADAVRTWIHTMKAYKAGSLVGTPMGTKGGAFIATFPGPDSRSSVPRRPQDEKSGKDVVELNKEAHKGKRKHSVYLYDFFGPSIDTGFRVLSKCSERHFTLSLEVAFALACVSLTPAPDQEKFALADIHLLGSDALKGVWGGQDYPLFALDLEIESPIHQAFVPFSKPDTSIEDVKRLCEACYTSEGWPFVLFLPDAQNLQFTDEPEDPLAGYVSSRGDVAEVKPSEGGSVELSGDDLPMAEDEPAQ